MHKQINDDFVLAFTTPVLTRRIDGHEKLNAGLKKAILKKAGDATGISHSNVGGWRSQMDFFNWPNPEVRELQQHIGENLCRMTAFTLNVEQATVGGSMVGWVNLLRGGSYNYPHTHPECQWSGVYYVEVGGFQDDKRASGSIEFVDPRSAVGMLSMPGNPFRQRLSFRPRNGLMLIFPSWLLHYVHSYEGDDERISVAFNISNVHQPK